MTTNLISNSVLYYEGYIYEYSGSEIIYIVDRTKVETEDTETFIVNVGNLYELIKNATSVKQINNILEIKIKKAGGLLTFTYAVSKNVGQSLIDRLHDKLKLTNYNDLTSNYHDLTNLYKLIVSLPMKALYAASNNRVSHMRNNIAFYGVSTYLHVIPVHKSEIDLPDTEIYHFNPEAIESMAVAGWKEVVRQRYDKKYNRINIIRYIPGVSYTFLTYPVTDNNILNAVSDKVLTTVNALRVIPPLFTLLSETVSDIKTQIKQTDSNLIVFEPPNIVKIYTTLISKPIVYEINTEELIAKHKNKTVAAIDISNIGLDIIVKMSIPHIALFTEFGTGYALRFHVDIEAKNNIILVSVYRQKDLDKIINNNELTPVKYVLMSTIK